MRLGLRPCRAPAPPPPPGGHSHYGGDADVRLQRPPIFSAAVPNDPIFLLIVSAVTQRPHIFGEMWALVIALTQRPPIFCIRLPQEATFCFNLIDKLIIFAILYVLFCFCFCFCFCFFVCAKKKKIKSNILTQCPLILNHCNLASHPVTPHFLRLCSHRMPQPLEV